MLHVACRVRERDAVASGSRAWRQPVWFACLPRAPCVRVQTLQYLWCRPTESVPTLYKIWQSSVRGYLTPNPIHYPSAGTVRKVGTWTAVAGLLILLSVFSDTDVAIVLRAERQLNLSGRAAWQLAPTTVMLGSGPRTLPTSDVYYIQVHAFLVKGTMAAGHASRLGACFPGKNRTAVRQNQLTS